MEALPEGVAKLSLAESGETMRIPENSSRKGSLGMGSPPRATCPASMRRPTTQGTPVGGCRSVRSFFAREVAGRSTEGEQDVPGAGQIPRGGVR